jgi:hypothetical protein
VWIDETVTATLLVVTAANEAEVEMENGARFPQAGQVMLPTNAAPGIFTIDTPF